MRDYKPKNICLPGTIWNQCILLIRDYDRLKFEYDNAIQDSPQPPDGQPRGRSLQNQTEREAIKRAQMSGKLRAIERAIDTVPVEYRKGIWRNIVAFERYPDDAATKTYTRWKSRLVYEVARNMFYI